MVANFPYLYIYIYINGDRCIFISSYISLSLSLSLSLFIYIYIQKERDVVSSVSSYLSPILSFSLYIYIYIYIYINRKKETYFYPSLSFYLSLSIKIYIYIWNANKTTETYQNILHRKNNTLNLIQPSKISWRKRKVRNTCKTQVNEIIKKSKIKFRIPCGPSHLKIFPCLLLNKRQSIYIYILSFTDRLFRSIRTLQCG